jgi:hypothetical protein
MFELGLGHAPTAATDLAAALERATDGVQAAGWQVLGSMASPVSGARGAPELLLHARRAGTVEGDDAPSGRRQERPW